MDTLVLVLAWSMSVLAVATALHNVSAIGYNQGVHRRAVRGTHTQRGGDSDTRRSSPGLVVNMWP